MTSPAGPSSRTSEAPFNVGAEIAAPASLDHHPTTTTINHGGAPTGLIAGHIRDTRPDNYRFITTSVHRLQGGCAVGAIEPRYRKQALRATPRCALVEISVHPEGHMILHRLERTEHLPLDIGLVDLALAQLQWGHRIGHWDLDQLQTVRLRRMRNPLNTWAWERWGRVDRLPFYRLVRRGLERLGYRPAEILSDPPKVHQRPYVHLDDVIVRLERLG